MPPKCKFQEGRHLIFNTTLSNVPVYVRSILVTEYYVYFVFMMNFECYLQSLHDRL